MEKYGQYRDKGSGIAPFFPVALPPSSPLLFPWHLFLVCLRVPLVAFAWTVWLLLIQWLPAGGLLRKANLWCILGIPGVWWADLQIDGVRRGSLARGSRRHLPEPGTIIASSCTSPLDVLCLAAIFDPIFTQSYAGSRNVRTLSVESAWASCFTTSGLTPPTRSRDLMPLSTLVKHNPNRIIVVFPETTTSNGRGILKFSHSLLSASPNTKVFSVSLRYTPSDVVTPIPGWLEAVRFLWRLNSRQAHIIRVRISSPKTMAAPPPAEDANGTPSSRPSSRGSGFESNYFDKLQQGSPPQTPVDGGGGGGGDGLDGSDGLTRKERRALDAVADDLARLGRVKRVSLGVEEKARFVEAWRKMRASR